jgi:hypothetical protein
MPIHTTTVSSCLQGGNGPVLDDDTTAEPIHHPHLHCEQLLVEWMRVVTTDELPTKPIAKDGHKCQHQMRMPTPMPDEDANTEH